MHGALQCFTGLSHSPDKVGVTESVPGDLTSHFEDRCFSRGAESVSEDEVLRGEGSTCTARVVRLGGGGI